MFHRFRPTSHFIAPHSWANDPCGAVYIPETKEYLLCYQWNPGSSEWGNAAWGMARSRDLVTWKDCPPALEVGTKTVYDSHGVFSGSIVSRILGGKRVLFLFYTSVSAMPIHWSKPYIEGCESQSVAISTDFGRSWNRYEHNPLISQPPKLELTTGWRDPFVSPWPRLSTLLGVDAATDYMLLASGERGQGCQLHLYLAKNLLNWDPVCMLLDTKESAKISSTDTLTFGRNFECGSFFSINNCHYIVVGVEEDTQSERHSQRYLLWLSGDLVLDRGKPKFNVTSHGLLDHGIAYAAHIFRDSEQRIIQLGWADECAKPDVVRSQGWAGCLPYPRELCQVSRPIEGLGNERHAWTIDEATGMMTTLGIRPAPQLEKLRQGKPFTSLDSLSTFYSTNFELDLTFFNVSGNETFVFSVRQSPQDAELTKIIFNLPKSLVTVDRSRASLEHLGNCTPDTGSFHLFPNENLHIRIFLDNSVVEVYANDRFALTSRIYPSLETSCGASYEFGGFDTRNVKFRCWNGLRDAWPERNVDNCGAIEKERMAKNVKLKKTSTVDVREMGLRALLV